MTQTEPQPSGLDADQLVVGIARGPGLWIADMTAEYPQDIDTEFGEGWSSLGYASEDGPTVSTSTDTEDIRGWQALGALRSVITGRTVTVQFQLMQWNSLNLALYWDIEEPTMQPDGTFAFDVRSDQAGRRHQIGLDVKDGDNEARIIFPRVQLNAAGDMQFQRSSAALLDVTFSALETQGRLVRVMGRILGSGAEPASAQAHQSPQTVSAGNGGYTPES
jgi:hypothetical protein